MDFSRCPACVCRRRSKLGKDRQKDNRRTNTKLADAHGTTQVVAWEDKDASSPSASPANSGNSVLRYGVVVIAGGGGAEGGGGGEGAGGGDDEDFDGGRASGRVGGGLRRLKVKLTPGRVDTLLSSQVCDNSCRARRDGGVE